MARSPLPFALPCPAPARYSQLASESGFLVTLPELLPEGRAGLDAERRGGERAGQLLAARHVIQVRKRVIDGEILP